MIVAGKAEWGTKTATMISESRNKLRALVQPFTPEEDSPGARLRIALKMMGAGIEMMRESLNRQHPTENPPQIEERLTAWVQYQPIPTHLVWRPDKLTHP